MENKPTKRSTVKEPKNLQKVVSGTAKIKKKSEARKFADVFIAEDAHNVKSYLFSDVMIPALKKLVADIIQDGIEMILYGGSRRSERRSAGFRADRYDYSSCSRDSRDSRRRRDDHSRSGYNYDDIVLSTRGDAEAILDRLDELIEMYKMASVADLYELAGLPDKFTDHDYGWTSLRNARVEHVRDGYLLKLPRPIPLD